VHGGVEGKPPLMGNQPSAAAKMGQRNGGGGGYMSPTTPTAGGIPGLDTRIVNNGQLTRKTTVVRQGFFTSLCHNTFGRWSKNINVILQITSDT